MIRLSNLRLEHNAPFKYGKPQCRIICDMEANFTDVKQFWFSVDDEHGNWLTDDVFDAFLVTMIYPAMYYGEDIEIRGNVSKEIWHNTMHYVQGVMKAYDPSFHNISINVQGFSDAIKAKRLRIGTGFSGGIDSFSTLMDNFFNTNDTDYKIDTLFFFHVGQYGNVKKAATWERAYNRFEITKAFAKEIDVDAVMMSTNMFDFYIPRWEYDAGVICRVASILAFQKILKRYYISNAITYRDYVTNNYTKSNGGTLAETSDPIILQLLSPSNLDILLDGAQYTRTEKTKNIADLPLAQKHLNVCVNSSDEHVKATNCGYCSKCLRTMMALDSIDALQKFSKVFDLSQWKKYSFGYKCEQVFRYKYDSFAQDNVDFARKHRKYLPNKFVATIVVCYLKAKSLPSRVIRKLKKMGNG